MIMVYDLEIFLLMVIYDGYNFIIFYGYDENLIFVRVCVEMINGI